MPIAERIQNGFSEDSRALIIKTGICVLSVLFSAVIISRLVYPFDSGFAEAFNWIPATHLLEGSSPYAYAFTPPYSMAPYGVVFYSLLAIGVKLFGFQLWWGKILSVLALAVCLWALAGITKALAKGDRQASMVSVLAGLAMFPAQSAIAVVRCTDLLAAAFSLAAFRLVLGLGGEKKAEIREISGLLLLTAAFFTKHTAALGAVFVVLRLAQLAKWRAAAVLALALTISIGGGIWLLDATSSGGYLWQHFTHARLLPHSFAASFEFFFLMLKTPAFFFFAVFLLFFIYRKRRSFGELNFASLKRLSRSPVALLLFYFCLSLGWSFTAAGRVGANVNYYTEASLIAAVICGLMYAQFRRGASAASPAALAMIVLLTLGGVFQEVKILRGEYYRWESLDYYREVFETVKKFALPGSKCISIVPEMVVWNGCAFHFDDYGEYSSGWDPALRTVFESEIKTGQYAVILWGWDTLPEQFPNYRLVPMSRKLPERYYPVYLYLPATSQEK